MKNIYTTLLIVCALGVIPGAHGEPVPRTLPPPVIVMKGASQPLLPPPASKMSPKMTTRLKTAAGASAPSVNMKVLVLAGDISEFSYQSITTYLDQIGVPYTGIAVDSLAPDGSGNRLSGLALTDSATGRGLYQGFIYTNSTFGVCNPGCNNLLSPADWTTLANYTAQFKVRVVTYYTYPERKWGLLPADSGASYTAANPLKVSLTSAGASIFSYMNSANPIAVSGSGTGGIFAYQATPVADTGEVTTPILTTGSYVAGVTHTDSSGQESMSLTMDNYPALLHSLAFSYGVINWVTKGVFLGHRQVYLNALQVDDILFGDRLYAPALPQCPNDPSCPVIIGTSADMQALANWQNARHTDPQVPHLQASYAFVGLGSTPGFAPIPDTVTPAMKAMASDFGWVNHTWTHGSLDCYSLSNTGACLPATLDQSLFEIETNTVFAQSLALPNDTTGIVTPFNGGLSNLPFFQAAAQEGVTSVISPDNPPSPGTGMPGPVPSILLMPRRATNLFYDVDSPLTGVYGSLPDEYNSQYGPNGKTPKFAADQSYSQIIDSESTMLLQLRLLAYEPYPLAFHMSNSIAYDGVHSMLTDLLDATIKKYEQLYTVPLTTLTTMRDIAPLLLNRASYNASGVTGVYTPGVSVVLTTAGAGVIPVTGACSQSVCPLYGNQMQDSVSMGANSSVTLSLTASAGVGLSAVTLNPGAVSALSPAQGLVTLNSAATANLVVTLSSDNSAAIVPSAVSINAGDSGAAFTVVTRSVTAVTTAIITATYNNLTRTFPLIVTPAIGLSQISLSSASVPAGNKLTGTVTLTGPAPAGGVVVSLVSNNIAALVPAGVLIDAGSSSATFSVNTLAVGGPISGNILAVYNGANITAALTVTPGIPVAISTLSLMPTAVVGGSVSTGLVTLNGFAPAGGIAVLLSSNSAAVVVPANVYVNAGSSTATFTINTTSVAVSTIAAISASYNGGSQQALLTVAPTFGLAGVSLNPASLTGGSLSEGTITLTGAAPAGGTVVSLSSNNTAVAGVPSTVTVAAGYFTATFVVTTTPVTSSTNVIITAAYGGASFPSTLTVNPAGPALIGISLNPVSVIAGAGSTGTVTLTGGAPAAGALISLSTDSPSATVPATVTVIAGKTSATFVVATVASSASTLATIKSTYNGVTQTATLTVNAAPAVLSGISLNPASVVAGTASTGIITLIGSAPAAGALISLSTDSPSATVPATVTVIAGKTSATFVVATVASSASTLATIKSTYNGVTQTATLTVNAVPAALSGISLNPASVVAGTASTGTITLTGGAPAAGALISLSSDSPSVTVAATVTVIAGKTSATFVVATLAGSPSTLANIKSTYSGVTQTATLTVNAVPAALSGISLNPASVIGGTSSTGTVTLTAAAPAGGIVVSLTSSNPAAVVPASVMVAQGTLTLAFPIKTTVVTVSAISTITAGYSGISKTAALTITPVAPTCPITPYLQVSGAPWQQITSVTVTSGSAVNLGPQPLGGTWNWTGPNGFISTTREIDSIPLSVGTNVFVATYTSASSCKSTGTFIVTSVAPAVALSAVSTNPTAVTGGTSSTGTVMLNGPAPAGGTIVSLSSNNTAAVVPGSVMVSAGSTTAKFAITTHAVPASQSITITATYNGTAKTSGLIINAPVLWALTLNPSSVAGGSSSTGTVTLNGPAPSGGTVVFVSTDAWFLVTVPAAVTVPAGSLTAPFTLSTWPFIFTWNVNVTAAEGGVSKTALFTVQGWFKFDKD